MHLPTDLLRTFVAVADTGNFTRAGEREHLTQSAVSMRVKRLEAEAGRELFRRGGQDGVTPTAEGRELLRYARRILALHDEAVSAVARPRLRGAVRLGTPEDFAARFVPDILAGFSKDHPEVRMDVVCAPGFQLTEMLEKGELDLAIRSGGEPKLGEEPLGREPLVWVSSLSSLVHEQEPVPLAVYCACCYYRQWALQALDRTGKGYRIAYTSRSCSGLQAAVSAGLAVAPMGVSTVPPNAAILGPEQGFPPLPAATVKLQRAAGATSEVVDRLADRVRAAFLETGRSLAVA